MFSVEIGCDQYYLITESKNAYGFPISEKHKESILESIVVEPGHYDSVVRLYSGMFNWMHALGRYQSYYITRRSVNDKKYTNPIAMISYSINQEGMLYLEYDILFSEVIADMEYSIVGVR